MDDYGYGGGSLLEDDLQGLLDAVDPAALDYRGWVDVGMALAAEGVPWEVWDAWSARDAARDYDEYRKRVDFLYRTCADNGLKLDTQNKNPSRLSRMPGAMRAGRRQWMVAGSMGRASWKELG